MVFCYCRDKKKTCLFIYKLCTECIYGIIQTKTMKDIYWIIDTSKLKNPKSGKWYNFTVPVPEILKQAAKEGYQIALTGGRIDLKGPAFFYLRSNIAEGVLLNNNYQPILASVMVQNDTTLGIYHVQYINMRQVLNAEVRLYIDPDELDFLIPSSASSEPTAQLVFHCRALLQ